MAPRTSTPPPRNIAAPRSPAPGVARMRFPPLIRSIPLPVGDLHQPLHCAKRRYGSSDNDKGGNAITVLLPDMSATGDRPGEKLHSVWDSAMLKNMIETAELSPNDYADKLNELIKPTDVTE